MLYYIWIVWIRKDYSNTVVEIAIFPPFSPWQSYDHLEHWSRASFLKLTVCSDLGSKVMMNLEIWKQKYWPHVVIDWKDGRNQTSFLLCSWSKVPQKIIPSSFPLTGLTGCWPKSLWEVPISTSINSGLTCCALICWLKCLPCPCCATCPWCIRCTR